MNNMNGKDFYNALVSGICKVISRHEHLNKINVFPVPDGDTGTNLLFTLRPVIKIKDDIPEHIGKAISLIANTCIDSARGNSGTIMAQYFVGMSEICLDYETISNKNLKELLNAGYTAAKGSMSEPKEGTIISVMRDVINVADNKKDEVSKIFKNIYDQAIVALNKTPDQMKLLKDAGVVDAGAQGYVDLLEGICYYIENGELLNPESIDDDTDTESTINIEEYDQSGYQFCTECIVEADDINRKLMKEKLSEMGDSFILAGTKTKVKVHIHTDYPQKIFKLCQDFGEVKNQKADDMHQQVESSHNSKSQIAIVTDSGCDIQYDTHNSNIHIVPVRYSFGDKEYIDKVSQTTEEFYNELRTNPVHPKTSQPPMGDFINKYENLSTHYDSIISIHIPEKLSGTLQSARNAKRRIKDKKITDIDSLSASVGLGLIVKSASELAKEINNHDKVVKKIETLIKNTKIFLTVNDIGYAIKGGRVPKYKGMIAKSLGLHPILTTDKEGKIKAASVLFGGKNLHNKFANFILKKLDKNLTYKISLGHSNAEDECHEIMDIIESNFNNIISIDLVDMGSGLGVHSGPHSFVVGIQEINE
tara:strand:- start:1713 stop:3485 length:1773 start_codon:yes stop_codon:yes gene_type:complete